MKLIDLLVLELPKLGGWPNGIDDIEMLDDGCVFFDGDCAPDDFQLPQCSDGWNRFKGSHYTNKVSREQYEAALAASKPQWDGNGLPPVGLVCEGKFPRHPGSSFEWQECLVLYVFERECAVKSKGTSTLNYCDDFRSIRSEEDKKRDAATDAMHKEWRLVAGKENTSGDLIDIYTSIYEAISDGKIPGVKLED